ncbi:MAG: hypothetical protein HFH66_01945 [Lachnospiraceae bacterium]|nr:hypothetical protein [Lachnospiraceae bacterium]
MDISIKKCIKEINKNHNVDEFLPKYVKGSMHYNKSYACYRLALEYFMFYETVSEELASAASSANEVLTAYLDCFIIYEYIFNRIQYRFDEMGEMPDDNEFIQKVISYVFASEDNTVVNENIRFMIEQLPMRMLSSKYFDIIHESVSLYKGSRASSLEGFEYMFRTNAMLYKDDNMSVYFTEFKQVLNELDGLKPDDIGEDVYREYSVKISSNISRIAGFTDMYMLMEGLVNALYIVTITECYKDGEENGNSAAMEAAYNVIKGVNSLFMKEESSVWKLAGDEPLGTNKEKLDWLSGFFDKVEGHQENISGILETAEAFLDEAENAHGEDIVRLGLAEEFAILKRMSLLNSSSMFADIDENENDTEVTAAMADETAGRLVKELKELFKGRSKQFKRAVMANTLGKLPVFFNNVQEVTDYIEASFTQCKDEAEKFAAKEIIMEEIG